MCVRIRYINLSGKLLGLRARSFVPPFYFVPASFWFVFFFLASRVGIISRSDGRTDGVDAGAEDWVRGLVVKVERVCCLVGLR